MAEKQSNQNVFIIKELKPKVIEFVIMFGIVSMISFSGANSIAQSIFDNLSTFFTSDFYMDGADLSILVNLFAAPLYLAFVAFSLVIAVIFDIVSILVFKKLYFKSGVKKEEKEDLYKYIKIIMAGFVLGSILIEAVIYPRVNWIIVYMLSYLPIPLIVFGIVRAKFKKIYN